MLIDGQLFRKYENKKKIKVKKKTFFLSFCVGLEKRVADIPM